MNKQTKQMLLWLLLALLLIAIVITFVLSPMIGLLLLAVFALAMVLIALFVPGLWSLIMPEKKTRKEKPWETEEMENFEPNMILECTRSQLHLDIPIDKPVMTIGRAVDCDFVFPQEMNQISGHHCRIEYKDKTKLYFITDLGSTNGTYVNSQRLSPKTQTLLKNGSIVGIHDLRYTFKEREDY